MASPLQSAWVVACVKSRIQEAFPCVQSEHPRRVLAEQCRVVLADRDTWWNDDKQLMQLFRREVDSLDHPCVFPPAEYTVGTASAEQVPMSNKPVAQEVQQEQTSHPQAALRPAGGIAGFETNKRNNAHLSQMEEQVYKQLKEQASSTFTTSNFPAKDEEGNAAATNQTGVFVEDASPSDTNDRMDLAKTDSATDFHMCHVVHFMEPSHQIKVPINCTVGQLAKVEWDFTNKVGFCKATSAVGSLTPHASEVQPEQIIRLVPVESHTQVGCGAAEPFHDIPRLEQMTRLDALWQQAGWVACDEMQFYMNAIQQSHPGNLTRLIIMPKEEKEMNQLLESWFGDLIEQAMDKGNDIKVYTVFWYQHHWFPVEVLIKEQNTEMVTTPDMVTKLQPWMNGVAGEVVTVRGQPVRSIFPADCGFQTIAWLRSQIQNQPAVTPMQIEEAIQMRNQFANQVNQEQMQMPTPLVLGGANAEQLRNELQILLEQHGVKPARSAQCAQHLLTAIGAPAIQRALGSAKPWPELKSLATQSTTYQDCADIRVAGSHRQPCQDQQTVWTQREKAGIPTSSNTVVHPSGGDSHPRHGFSS